MQPSDPQAKCALHPDRPATRTCPRCGTFACGDCVPSPEVQCPTCQQLTGQAPFPFTRDAFTLDALWSYAFAKWKREWVMLAVAFLIVTGAQWIGGLISSAINLGATAVVGNRLGTLGSGLLGFSSTLSNNILGVAISGTFQMGFIKITLDVIHGKRADLGEILTQFRKLGRYLVAYFLTVATAGAIFLVWAAIVVVLAAAVAGLSFGSLPELKDFDFARSLLKGSALVVVALGFLAYVPAVIFVWVHFQLATFELVHTDCGPLEAIARAYRMTEGHRLTAAGYAFVAGVILFLGLLACCIGIFPAAGLAECLSVTLFLTLRAGRST